MIGLSAPPALRERRERQESAAAAHAAAVVDLDHDPLDDVAPNGNAACELTKR
jgi:hypothetical protein